MPPVAKKRRTGRAGLNKKTVTAPSPPRGIQAYGKISKPQPCKQLAGKSNSQANEKTLSTPPIPIEPTVSTPSKKRKAQHIDEDPEIRGDPDHQAGLNRVEHHDEGPSRPESKPSPRRGRPPKTPRKKALFTSIPIETPTKGARSVLESLDLSSSPSSRQVSSPPTSRANTPASSPPPTDEGDLVLPDEIQDLINLHSSFLTALSLHYAHHGSLAPVDFRNLRPNIERSWRKRRVSVRDVQQILSLQQQSSSTAPKLSLSDYGCSKTCIEIKTSSKDLGTHRRPLDEELLNKAFYRNLLDRWTRRAEPRDNGSSTDDFIRSLPLAPITPCTSTTALAPLLAKGQRRLEDLKAGAIRAQARSQPRIKPTVDDHNTKASDAENIPPTSTDSTNKPSSNSLAARKTSLFDRIKAKQEARLLSAALRAPLTPVQLQRKSALRRIEEIVPVLELLCSGAGVKTFTMPTVVQNLQMSLRNPIEKEEAVRAVRLLAEAVAPGWVGVREVGKVVGVTVRREGMVGGKEGVMRKVRELEEAL
ncbi:MAG: hypothetical protein LQ345_000274 [Seirophora villosa]|nr:MAG: hypothetical protein LQ345_000274 [Seirophora villosa]